MAKKGKKKYTYTGGPYNKYTRYNKAKAFTNTSSAEPTIDTFSDIQNSNDLSRPTDDTQEPTQIRPSKKNFDAHEHIPGIAIAIVTAIIIGIGGYLVYDRVELESAKKDIDSNKKSIDVFEKKQEKMGDGINEINTNTKLINYRLEKIESKIDNSKK